MLKKMMLLALSVGALVAFAAPAAAQADELYEEIEGPLEFGAEVTARSINTIIVATQLGVTVECSEVIFHLRVQENGPEIELSPTAEPVTTFGCSTAITNATPGTVTLSEGQGTATGATFLIAGVCDYSGSIAFNYQTESDQLIAFSTLFGNCGFGHLDGVFTLETRTGTPIYIS
jgi:hypothetical protein